MKKIITIISIIVLGGAGVYLLTSSREPTVRPELKCQTAEMTYFYRPECSWCQQIKRERVIEKIKELGVEVEARYSSMGSVPRFLINDETHTGYRTLEQLKELLGC